MAAPVDPSTDLIRPAQSLLDRQQSLLAALQSGTYKSVTKAFAAAITALMPVATRFNTAYNTELGRLQAEARNNDEDPTAVTPSLMWLVTSGALDDLLAAMQHEMELAAAKSAAAIIASQDKAAALGVTSTQHIVAIMNSVPPVLVKVPAVNQVKVPAVLAAGQATSGKQVATTTADQSASDTAAALDGLAEGAATALQGRLKSGISLGMLNTTANQLVIQTVVQQMLTSALGLGHDSISSSMQSSVMNIFRANPGYVNGWIWRCRFDNSCIACIIEDGSIHDNSETLDSHRNCDCYQEPYNGPLPTDDSGDAIWSFGSGRDWFLAQDEEMQASILGPSKLLAWQEGDIDLADLVSGEGGYIHEASLKSLGLDYKTYLDQLPRGQELRPVVPEMKPALPKARMPQSHFVGTGPVTIIDHTDGAAARAYEEIFGYRLSDEEIGQLLGAQPGDFIELQAASSGEESTRISDLTGAEFESPHVRMVLHAAGWDQETGTGDIYRSWREVYRNEDGFTVMSNISNDVVPELQGEGIGSYIFATQVQNLTDRGDIAWIEAEAAGDPTDPGLNGYKTWARLGYDANFSDMGIDPEEDFPPEFAHVTTMQELMAEPGGYEWWSANGDTWEGKFDLAPGSISHEVLDGYVADHGYMLPDHIDGRVNMMSGMAEPFNNNQTEAEKLIDQAADLRAQRAPLQAHFQDAVGRYDTASDQWYEARQVYQDAKADAQTRLREQAIEDYLKESPYNRQRFMELDHLAQTATGLKGDSALADLEAMKMTAIRRAGITRDVLDAEPEVAAAKAEMERLQGELEHLEMLRDSARDDLESLTTKITDLERQADISQGGRGYDIQITGIEADLHSALEEFTGRTLSRDEIGALVGGQPGDRVELGAINFGDESMPDWHVNISLTSAATDDNTGEVLYRATRELSRGQYDQLVMHNDLIEVAKGHQGEGWGIKVFAQEVKQAKELGVSYIAADAAGFPGDPQWNGYYTWARFGYDAELRSFETAAWPVEYRDATSLHDLLSRPGGLDFWHDHGFAFSGTFDLTDGSMSHQILDAYLKSKGLDIQPVLSDAEKAIKPIEMPPGIDVPPPPVPRSQIQLSTLQLADLPPVNEERQATVLRAVARAQEGNGVTEADRATQLGWLLDQHLKERIGDNIVSTGQDAINVARNLGNLSGDQLAWYTGDAAAIADHGGLTINEAIAQYSAAYQQATVELLSQARDLGGDLTGFNSVVDPQMLHDAIGRLPTDWIDASNTMGGVNFLEIRANDPAGYNGLYMPAMGPGTIRVRLDGQTPEQIFSTIVHEMAHRFEASVDGIWGMEADFYAARTAGEDLVSMANLPVMARRDRFTDVYIGRDPIRYPFGPRGRPFQTYELLSRGVEWILGKEPTAMYWLERDNEYRRFVLGILFGLKNGGRSAV
jgi:uncharacterized protein YukE